MGAYDYVLPQVFPWVLKHVDASAAKTITTILIEDVVSTDPDSPPPPSGSSFAVVAGVRYAQKRYVDIWLSDVSKRRLERMNPDMIFTVPGRGE